MATHRRVAYAGELQTDSPPWAGGEEYRCTHIA
jgi:hypothetical protein